MLQLEFLPTCSSLGSLICTCSWRVNSILVVVRISHLLLSASFSCSSFAQARASPTKDSKKQFQTLWTKRFTNVKLLKPTQHLCRSLPQSSKLTDLLKTQSSQNYPPFLPSLTCTMAVICLYSCITARSLHYNLQDKAVY